MSENSMNLLASDIKEICDSLSSSELALLEGRHVLLTGSNGFLGRYFTAVFLLLNRDYLKRPAHVTAVDNFISSQQDGTIPKDPHFRFCQHDASTPYPTALMFPKVDYVVAAAGLASPAYYRKYPLETIDVTTLGLRVALETARTHNARLLYFSSSEIYGDPAADKVPTNEEYRGNVSTLGPRSCYDEAKRIGETLCYTYWHKYQTEATIVRPFNVFGPGLSKEDYRVIPNFGARITAGQPVNIYGSGDQTRTFCYVTDAISGFLKVLLVGLPAEAYNVGNPEPEISMKDLAKAVGTATGKEVLFNVIDYPADYPADEPNRRCPDITKVRTLGYAPRVALQDGLQRFFGWAVTAYR